MFYSYIESKHKNMLYGFSIHQINAPLFLLLSLKSFCCKKRERLRLCKSTKKRTQRCLRYWKQWVLRCPPEKKEREESKREIMKIAQALAKIFTSFKREMFLRRKVELGFHYIHSTIYIHFIYPYTCTSWFDCMTRFSLDPLFDFTTYALQVCMRCLHTYELYISLSCRKRNAQHHYFCLGEDSQIPHILRDLRVAYNGISKFYFENL